MSTLPPVSLIICSRNRPRLLWDSVESVLQGTEVPAEVLILDQSDHPHRRLAAYVPSRACAIRYCWSHTRGLSRARTQGVSAAAHEILVFLDDDMLVPAEWLGILVRALLAAGPRAVVTGQVQPMAERRGGFQLAVRVDPNPAVYRGCVAKDVLAGGHMAAYRAALDAVGGFDPRLGPGTTFPAAEDNDLGFRLLEAGYAVHYVPDAVVYHRAWRTRRDYLPLRWSYGVGQGAFYAKHLARHRPYITRRLGRDLRRLVQHPAHLLRDRRWTVGYSVFLLGELAGASHWLLGRQGRRARP